MKKSKSTVKSRAYDAFVAFLKSHHAYTPWITAARRRLDHNMLNDSVDQFLVRNQPAMWMRRSFMWCTVPIYTQSNGYNYSCRWDTLSKQWEALCKKNSYETF